MALVDKWEPLGTELLNHAFLSCWTELPETLQVSDMVFLGFVTHICMLGRSNTFHRGGSHLGICSSQRDPSLARPRWFHGA